MTSSRCKDKECLKCRLAHDLWDFVLYIIKHGWTGVTIEMGLKLKSKMGV